MNVLDEVVTVGVYASLVVGAVKSYLVVNKVWIRKHEAIVAESQSVAAALLGIATMTPFLLKYGAVDGDLGSFIRTATGLGVTSFFLMVGVGLWVRGNRRVGFWLLLRRSLQLERLEAGDLARALSRPAGSRKIMEVLSALALVDRKMTQHETRFIEVFARTWQIDWKPEEAATRSIVASADDTTMLLMETRRAMTDYLAISPPVDQVAQLRDVVRALTRADDEIAFAEAMILTELEGLMDEFMNSDDEQIRFEVLLVPQSSESEATISQLLPHLVSCARSGGFAFVVGSYCSEAYAEMVRDEYRELRFFATMEKAGLTEA